MQNDIKSEKLKYSLVYFLRYMGDSFFYPFVSLFLTNGLNYSNKDYSNLNPNIYTSKGLSIEYAGYLLLILPLVSIFINPLWTIVGKSLKNNKKFVTIFSLIEGLVIIVLSCVGMSFTILFVMLFFIAIVGQPIYLLLDSFTKVYADKKNIDYVSIRVYGSVAYVVGAILSGIILKVTNTNYLYVFCVCGMLFILTSCVLINIKSVKISKDKTYVEKPNFRELFKNKDFYLILFFFLFSYGTMSAIDTYVPNYFDSIFGFGASNYSYLLAAFVIVEVVLMFILSKKGNFLNVKKMAFVMVFLLSARWLIFSLSDNLYLSVIAQLLRGISMAIYIFIFLKMVVNYVKTYNLTACIIFISSIIAIYRVLLIFIGGKSLLDVKMYRYWFLFGAILSFSSVFYLTQIGCKKIQYEK